MAQTTTVINLWDDARIFKDFTKHRGSTIILIVLHSLERAPQEELMRIVGSQKCTEQSIEWLLKMHMIAFEKQS